MSGVAGNDMDNIRSLWLNLRVLPLFDIAAGFDSRGDGVEFGYS